MSEVRVRFAPSPTGYLHVGGARTALFNYLFAKNTNGKFILRIEDTDLARSTDESINAILRSMKWLGLNWDEGPEIGGEYGPYFQTQRLELYKKYAEQLLESGHAYYCFCEQTDKKDDETQVGGKYPGTCRNIGLDEAKKRISLGEKAAIRFKMPATEIKFNDLVRGELSFDGSLFSDLVIIRKDGIPTYNYAVVIDDALMKITHVLRGDDHISNTPKQIAIYNALNFKLPYFAHISMILGPDGTRLSKRHGATSVEEYKKIGILPDAFINYLALLGWSTNDNREIFNKDELIKEFSLQRVSKNPAIFDTNKLKWMNGVYIRSMDDEKLTNETIPFLLNANLITEEDVKNKKDWLIKIIKAVKKSFDILSEVPEKVKIFLNENYNINLEDEEAKKVIENKENTKTVIEFVINELKILEDVDLNKIKSLIKTTQKKLNVSPHDVFMPLRISLTGTSSGPGVYEMLDILGKDKVINRLLNFVNSYC